MADHPSPAKLNECYLLHTNPTKVFRKLKGIDIEVIQIGSDGRYLSFCEPISNNKLKILRQRLDRCGGIEVGMWQFDLKSRRLKPGKEWSMGFDRCEKPSKYSEPFTVLAKRREISVLTSGCVLCPTERSDYIQIRKNGSRLLTCAGDFKPIRQSDKVLAFCRKKGEIESVEWKDLEKGIFNPKSVGTRREKSQQGSIDRYEDIESEHEDPELQEYTEDDYSDNEVIEITDIIIERAGYGILWSDNFVQLPKMKVAVELKAEGVTQWDCMLKVDKNRYAVGGYRVIKLVDSQLRPVSTVTFPPSQMRQITGEKSHSPSMTMVGSSALLASTSPYHIHLLQYRRRLLSLVQANVKVFDEDPELQFDDEERILKVQPAGKSKAVMGSTYDRVAIIKLVFK